MMSDNKNDKENFTRLFNSFLIVFELEEDLVCSKLKISKATFNRWVAGISAPHPLGQDAVFHDLDDLNNNTPTKEVD
jgi:hypothetical protein